jgi:hypothetical protein
MKDKNNTGTLTSSTRGEKGNMDHMDTDHVLMREHEYYHNFTLTHSIPTGCPT